MQIEYPGVVPANFAVAASSSVIIPVGSRGYLIIILTGTATIQNGADAAVTVPAGTTQSDDNTNLVPITVTTAAASTAYVAYNKQSAQV